MRPPLFLIAGLVLLSLIVVAWYYVVARGDAWGDGSDTDAA